MMISALCTNKKDCSVSNTVVASYHILEDSCFWASLVNPDGCSVFNVRWQICSP